MGTLVFVFLFFCMVETILLIWSARGMAEIVILPPAGEWPRAVDGEESCPSWMSLIGGEQWLSPQADCIYYQVTFIVLRIEVLDVTLTLKQGNSNCMLFGDKFTD